MNLTSKKKKWVFECRVCFKQEEHDCIPDKFPHCCDTKMKRIPIVPITTELRADCISGFGNCWDSDEYIILRLQSQGNKNPTVEEVEKERTLLESMGD